MRSRFVRLTFATKTLANHLRQMVGKVSVVSRSWIQSSPLISPLLASSGKLTRPLGYGDNVWTTAQ